MKTTVAAGALALLAACSYDENWWREERRAGVPTRQVALTIQAMYDGFKARDLEAVGEFMAEDSTCYDVYSSTLLVGRRAVLDHFKAILERHPAGEKWESSLEDMQVKVSGDTAVATYKVRTGAGGDHSLAAVTHVFRLKGGRWLASHLHRSWNTAK